MPDNSSLMSSESATERDVSDEEILSFDLGTEPYDPFVQERLPSDEWLDDFPQGLMPPGSAPGSPKVMEYDLPSSSLRQSLAVPFFLVVEKFSSLHIPPLDPLSSILVTGTKM